jgi:phosphoribosyl-dephospho-CoA transferase
MMPPFSFDGCPATGAYPTRHALVWVDRLHWQRYLSAKLPSDQLAAAQAWFRSGRPAVARRRRAAEPDGVSLGIPLSQANGGARIALILADDAIREIQPPPSLARVIPAAPPAWRQALKQLIQAARTHGVSFRVYGSLAWQYLTGECYVTTNSDVDLLFYPADYAQLGFTLQLLQDWEQKNGLRADGECISASGMAIAWREMLCTRDKWLTKDISSARLTPRAEIFQTFSFGGSPHTFFRP